METDKNIDFIFKENKESKVIKKKSIFKRIIVLSIILFFLLNLSFYVGFYNNYVRHAPEQLKNGRKDLIIAHIFSMYEVIAVQLGISFTNPILKFLQIPKEYFYNKGIKKLPKNVADKVYWYQMLMYYPIVYELSTSGYKVGNVTHNYGIAFTENLLNDIYINLEILSKYELSDYKNNEYIQKKLLWLAAEMFTIYIYNYHLFDDVSFYSEKAIWESENNIKIEKLIFVYLFIEDIFSKTNYQEDFKKYILTNPDYKLNFYETFFEANALIIYNKIYHKKFICNDEFNKKLMNNFIVFKKEIEKIIHNKKARLQDINHVKITISRKYIKRQELRIQDCMKQQKGE